MKEELDQKFAFHKAAYEWRQKAEKAETSHYALYCLGVVEGVKEAYRLIHKEGLF